MKITSEVNGSSLIDGTSSEIYISIGDFSFPESKWTDFPVIILNWWTEQLIDQIQGKVSASYLFMDGPYYFDCEFSNGDEITIYFNERTTTGPNMILLTSVSKIEFISEIKMNVNSVLRQCHQHNYTSKDVSNLEFSFSRLLNILKIMNK
jgi:hypothetical protein